MNDFCGQVALAGWGRETNGEGPFFYVPKMDGFGGKWQSGSSGQTSLNWKGFPLSYLSIIHSIITPWAPSARGYPVLWVSVFAFMHTWPREVKCVFQITQLVELEL